MEQVFLGTPEDSSRARKLVEELKLHLLQAGIDVQTTVNVQHLESLNDLVAQITGIVVSETIPDLILEKANEIELVDLPPDELIQRLHEGKVYLPETVNSALDNFFKKGNLIALREMALRITAERVDAEMLRYRHDKSVSDVWPVSVFINQQQAGMTTATLSGAKALYVPLIGSKGAIGVIGVLPRSSDKFSNPEEMHLLDTCINQTALAVERAQLSERRQT